MVFNKKKRHYSLAINFFYTFVCGLGYMCKFFIYESNET